MKSILIFILLFTSCTSLDDIAYNQFNLYKKFQYTKQIKLNGEYWAYDSLYNIHWLTYLYSDGSFFMDGYDKQNTSKNCIQINEKSREVGWWWGFFNIDGNKMEFNYINPSSINSHSKYQVSSRLGSFLNDSTFTENVTNFPKRKSNYIYFHFRECLNKPDSNNVILKNIGR
jgi:hypothetical protein